jgi:O-antigen biosynthesis protein WbqV
MVGDDLVRRSGALIKGHSLRVLAELALGMLALSLAQLVAAPDYAYWNATEGTIGAGLHVALIYGALAALIAFVNGSTREPWRNFAILNAMDVLRGVLYSWIGFVVLALALGGQVATNSAMIALALLLHSCLVMASRFFMRAAGEGTLLRLFIPRRFASKAAPRNALIVAGPVVRVEAYLRSMQRDDLVRNIVGAITTEDGWTGQKLRNTEVYGHISQLRELLRDPRYPIDGILFVCEPSEVVNADTLAALKSEGITLLRLPRAEDLDVSKKAPARPREIRLDDLLPRPPLKLSPEPVRELICGRRVMITGAGGSIGAELVRQVAALEPAHLVLLDNCEYNLFRINQELRGDFPGLSVLPEYCDVRDRLRLHRVMSEARPELVFHAAALKHLPLMQANPAEAALTNIVGTSNVTQIASEIGVGALVLVSTDKAVRPSNVMGATKRLAESVMHGLRDKPGNVTRPIIVRFGNVLGSSGSVVPLFKEQIRRGGPVLVTDPNVSRFFMTIPEAVILILHATALALSKPAARRDGVYVLEMGEPVKILDLAKRMIAFYSPDAHQSIPIHFTGLAEGEKLSEELIDHDESAYKSPTPGILEVRSEAPPRGLTEPQVRQIETFLRSHSNAEVRNRLFELLGEMRTSEPVQTSQSPSFGPALAEGPSDEAARVVVLSDRNRR